MQPMQPMQPEQVRNPNVVESTMDPSIEKLKVLLKAQQGPKITSSSLSHDNTTFHHFALVYNSGTYTMYVDGSSVGSQANSSVLTTLNGYAVSLPYYIGSRANIDSYFNGYLDDLRITKGVARYTTNFTAPISAHQTK